MILLSYAIEGPYCSRTWFLRSKDTAKGDKKIRPEPGYHSLMPVLNKVHTACRWAWELTVAGQCQEEKRILETACSPTKPQKDTDNEGSEGRKA